MLVKPNGYSNCRHQTILQAPGNCNSEFWTNGEEEEEENEEREKITHTIESYLRRQINTRHQQHNIEYNYRMIGNIF